MAEAEQAGIGAFLSSLGSSWQRQQGEQKRKHEQWMSCIMQGVSAKDCSRIIGYDPGEEARGGAESIGAGQRAADIEEKHQQRLKFGRETSEKYTSIPVEEAGELDIPVDWKQAMITPERVTTAVKMTPGQISEARWKRGGTKRDIAKEGRAEKAKLAEEERKEKGQVAKERRAEKRGVGKETTTQKERDRAILSNPPSQATAGERLDLQNSGWMVDKEKDEWTLPEKNWNKAFLAWRKDLLHRKKVGKTTKELRGLFVEDMIMDPREKQRVMKKWGLTNKQGDAETIYNKCREAGRTIEQCKVEAGV